MNTAGKVAVGAAVVAAGAAGVYLATRKPASSTGSGTGTGTGSGSGSSPAALSLTSVSIAVGA